ncbi:heparinase II/III-family protein [Kribbella sp. NBC_01505]|uniref:heparinase II/III domain-containing protein n=1 Tax=Kribbella sp. NBC_01505 TaxID=2903580 RepID=UPI00386E2D73
MLGRAASLALVMAITGGSVVSVPAVAVSTAAAAKGHYACPGYSTIDDAVPLSSVMKDTFVWSKFKPTKVGNGKGNINWKANPYKNPSWYMWLHSLRWIGQGITAASAGNKAALAHVTAIAKDWVKDNPYSWKANPAAHEATMHRTNVLLCLREAVLKNLGATKLPKSYAWLDAALVNHARFMTANWGGKGNHGTDESIALFGVGCTLNRGDFKKTAQTRLGTAITTAIDAQGATNEQSTGYAQFNYNLWGRAAKALQDCGVDPGKTIRTRRTLLATFIAHATAPSGMIQQLGDTEYVRTDSIPGTPAEYAATQGRSGKAPKDRVKIYSAGYVFGRSGWGSSATPFAAESAYSLRFGPKRVLHGHSDHTSITYQARGRDILSDAGYSGYADPAWRSWVLGPSAHNEMVTPKLADTNPITKLTRSRVRGNADFFELTDAPAAGVTRTRGVLILRKPDVVVTLDRASAKTAQQFQTLWHLPSDQRATVSGRAAAVAKQSGDKTRTVLIQLPYKGALPAGSTLVKTGQTKPIQGWHFPHITTRKAASTVVFARAGKSVTILSLIVPVRANGKVTYKTRMSGTTYVVDLNVDGVRASFGITGGGSLVRVS